jgi:hypothetical protein
MARRPSIGQKRLGDHAGGVGEVDEPRLRAVFLHQARQLHHVRDGPEGVGDAAGSGGFLTQHAQVAGHPFVRHPAGSAAGADGGKHHLRILQRPGEVSGGKDRQLGPGTGPGMLRSTAVTASRREGSTSCSTSSVTTPEKGPETSAR